MSLHVVKFPRHMTFTQDIGFPCNKSWHSYAMCMIVVSHTIKPSTNLITATYTDM